MEKLNAQDAILAMVLFSGFAGLTFAGLTNQPGVFGEWIMAACRFVYEIGPLLGSWAVIGCMGCLAYSVIRTGQKRSAKKWN